MIRVLIHSPLVAAGVFGSMGMLAWATAALIPLILHLWNRKKHREAPWAAMEFLLAAVQEQSRRIRLEQLLLLLLRMAIPIVLALSLADPIWQWLPSIGSSLSSRASHHHVFVFDTSYSMNYRVGGTSRLEQAVKLASGIVNDSPQGDGFTLVTISQPSQVLVGEPVFAKEDILVEIAAVGLRDTEGDLLSSLDLCLQTLESVRKNTPRLTKHRVYIFSDLGANTWQAAANPDVRKRIGSIEKVAEILTVDVGIDDPKNIGIASVGRSDQTVTPARPFTWQVTLTDHTGNSAGDHDVAMLVDGQLIDKQKVSIAPGESTGTSFRYQFDRSGQHAIEFQLTDDGLAVDNHYYEVVTVRESINVLCVEGVLGAAANVAIALAPSENSQVMTRVLADHRLDSVALEDYDCIFICNVGRFTAERTSQLRDYLKRGRSVVLFLGDQVQIENYNELLAGDDPLFPRLLPGTLTSLAPPGTYRFDPKDYRHPIIQPFAGQERSGLLTTPVYRYVGLELPADTRANVALEFAGGDPVIVEHLVCGGRLTLVTTAASEQSVTRQADRVAPWTAWSAWPSFPPVVQEMLAMSVSGNDDARNQVVGESIYSTVPASSGAQFVTVKQPSTGLTRRVAVTDGDGPPTWQFDETFSSGLYSATLSDVEAVDSFAVNLADTNESKLERVNVGDLPSQFQNSINASSNEASPALQTASTPMFRLILGLLLVLLLTESFAAWYLGNARA